MKNSIQAKIRISYKSIIKKTSEASKNSRTSYDTSMLSHGSFIVVRVMVVLDVFVVVEVQCSAPHFGLDSDFFGKSGLDFAQIQIFHKITGRMCI